MANVKNSNVYIYKPKIDQYEQVNSLGVINLSKIESTIKKKVSTDRASMILRKHDHSVLQSLCSIYQHLLDFLFHYMQFTFIENALS